MKTLRMCAAAIAVAVAISVMPASLAAETRPLRSGTVVMGLSHSWTGTGCVGNAECSAWLQGGCKAALAGKDPSVSASIVDVRKLAGSETMRSFQYRSVTPRGGGRMVAELWGPRCERFSPDGVKFLGFSGFRIPKGVAWMTVTTGGHGWLDFALVGAPVSWELR